MSLSKQKKGANWKSELVIKKLKPNGYQSMNYIPPSKEKLDDVRSDVDLEKVKLVRSKPASRGAGPQSRSWGRVLFSSHLEGNLFCIV